MLALLMLKNEKKISFLHGFNFANWLPVDFSRGLNMTNWKKLAKIAKICQLNNFLPKICESNLHLHAQVSWQVT